MKTKTAKIATSLLILALALCLALPSSLAAGSSGRDRLKPSSSRKTANNYLISMESFIQDFNFYSAFMDDGHELSIVNAFDFEKMGDRILYKTIFNDCEILSLWLTDDIVNVESIQCTWSSNKRNADKYLNDFLQMLMEALLSCGMEADSASSMFASFGGKDAFKVGDTGELTMDGIVVSYKVDAIAGVTFTIQKEQK